MKRKTWLVRKIFRRSIIIFALVLGASASIYAQSTVFTYQGKLVDGALPASASYDFEFRLFDSLTGGTQLGSVVKSLNVPVANGIFTVQVDFGSQFNGEDRFLEISVRPAGGGALTVLKPRQPITSTPHSIRSLLSTSADGLSAACVACVTDAHIQSLDGSKLTGTITGDGSGLTNLNGANITNNTINASALASDTFPNSRNLSLLGSLRWDLLEQRVNVGSQPRFTAFDGSNIWVTNSANNTVTKLRASDGSSQGTFAVGTTPFGIVFDGVSIWVTNSNSGNVTKLRASDGAVQGTFAVGGGPSGIAFDGTNIWVAIDGANTVKKLQASDGTLLGTFPVGINPGEIAFDGVNIWVGIQNGSSVTKLRASDGSVQGTFTVGSNPRGVAFDGANIWVVNEFSANVVKLRASDGALQGTFPVGTNPIGIAFDGVNIWVANNGSSNVTKLRASDGALLGTFAVDTPLSVTFDGANVWVSSFNSNFVAKLPVFP